MTNHKTRNLLLFGTLLTLSGITSAMMGYVLCRLLYVAPHNFYTFTPPQWLHWATGTILPIFSIVQTILLFKFYLYVQELKVKHIREKLLPFTITFVLSWLVLSPWAMVCGLLCKWQRIAPNTPEAAYLSVLKASLEAVTQLGPMAIIVVCIALYATCIWHAFKNVFGDYLPGTRKQDSAIHQ